MIQHKKIPGTTIVQIKYIPGTINNIPLLPGMCVSYIAPNC